MEPDVCVVIPAHNEARSIFWLVLRLKQIFPLVVVVDDGSRDDTGKKAAEAGAIVLRHNVCQGKGAALKTGFQQALKLGVKAVLTMDADGQHRVEEAPAFIQAWKKSPAVSIWLGRRNFRAEKMPFLRRVTNLVMSFLISFLGRQFIPDTQTGYRLIKNDVLKVINLVTNHFETESELLLKACWKGFKIGWVPISTVYGEEKSKIRPVPDTLRFIRMLAALLWMRKR